MTSRFSAIAVLAMTAGLAACSSPAPIHYYTLLPPPAVPPAAATAAAAQAASPFLIDVLPVGLPEHLDQQPLVVRQSGSGAVTLMDEERWVGPLGDELRNALSVHLAERLGTQDVAGLASSSDQKVLRVKVQVRRFDAWLNNQVQLEAGWSMGFAQDGKARLVCQGRFTEPATDGYPGLVQAQQQAVSALAARIASDARNWGRSQQARCTTQ